MLNSISKPKNLSFYCFVLAVFVISAGTALAVSSVELHKLTASDAAAGDLFGESVALSGFTALVGARGNDDAGSYSGSAYLYDFSDACNIIETKLTASDAAADDFFSLSVAIGGSTALVGAPLNDDAGSASGSAYLYDFSDPCNIIETKLTASDAAAGDVFGFSVALSGATALVGAFANDDAGSVSGSAYLYDFSDPCNIIETKLTASDAAAADMFGRSVALNGATALVGAILDDDAGSASGSAYLYDFSDPCSIIETKLTASDAAAGDQFGYSVALSGATAIVGAILDDDAGSNSGSAYLFDVATGSQIAKLTASDPAASDWFGYSVAISSATALVGARFDDDAGDRSGSAYLFDFSDPCNIIETKLTASDAAASDEFGYSVALSGATALVGTYHDDDACPGDPGCNSGSAYIFVRGPILVDIDIKPGSCPNPLNVRSKGVLPVAILGSEGFDVNTIDVASIRLAGVAPIRSSYEDVAAPVWDRQEECECTTEGPDGNTDLALKFETEEIVEELVSTLGELTDGDVLVLTLTGALSDETPIEGADCIVVLGKVPRPIAARISDINGDGIVNILDFGMIAEHWLESTVVED